MLKRIKINTTVDSLIVILVGIIVYIMTIQNIFTTSFYGIGYEENGGAYEKTFFVKDNFVLQFFVIFGVVLFLFMGSKMYKNGKLSFLDVLVEHEKKTVLGLLFVFSVVGGVWIIVSGMTPGDDPEKVLYCVEQWRQGNFSSFAEGGYFFRYPFQAGMTLFFYFFSFIFGYKNVVGMQVINLVSTIIVFLFLIKIAGVIWPEHKTERLVLLAFLVTWMPMYQYLPYMYCIFPSLAFSVSSIYYTICYLKSRKWKYIILVSILMGISVLIKSNTLLFFVAIICFLLYDVVENRKMLSIIFVIALIIGKIGCGYVSDRYIENMSGYAMPKGEVMISWAAMGLDDSKRGYGRYNGYIWRVYYENGYNQDLAVEESKEKIMQLLTERFSDIRHDALPFFARKNAFQWAEPNFAGLHRCQNSGISSVAPDYVHRIVNGKLGIYSTIIMNYIITLIWVGVLLYILFYKRRKELYELVGLVSFLGCFLFYVIWESCPSYTLPFFTLIIPYSFIGYSETLKLIDSFGAVNVRQRNISELVKRHLGLIIVVASTVLVILCRNTSLVRDTIALDMGAEAQEQFWLVRGNNDSQIKLYKIHEGEGGNIAGSYTVAVSGDTCTIRSDITGKVLCAEVDDSDYNLIEYIDDRNNVFKERREDIIPNWNIELDDNDNAYFKMGDKYLTYYDGGFVLEEKIDGLMQKWQID